jgi:3-hydroxyisobutyrate dehydrogenase
MGQSIKLVNNLALAIQMTSICETFAAGHLLGISPAIQHEVFSTSTSRCWSVDTYVPLPSLLPNVPANNSYNGGFGVDLMLKDLTLCIHEIKQGLHNLKGEQGSQKIWKE